MDINIHSNIETLRNMVNALENLKSPVNAPFVNAARSSLNHVIRRLEEERSTPKPTTALDRIVAATPVDNRIEVRLNAGDVWELVREIRELREKFDNINKPPLVLCADGTFFNAQAVDALRQEVRALREQTAQVPEIGRCVTCPSDGSRWTGTHVDNLRLSCRRDDERFNKIKDVCNGNL